MCSQGKHGLLSRLAIAVLLMLALRPSWGDQLPGCSDSGPANDIQPLKWFVSFGMASNHPQLEATENQIDTEVNRTFRLMSPGFDDVKTFQDQANEFMIWTPFISVARKLSTRWDVFAQVGYTAGTVHTQATNPSLLLLPLHTDVSFKRSAFFAGLGVEWFPWEMPEHKEYSSVFDRLKGTKPFLGTTLNWNCLTADADIKAGVKPLGNLLRIKQHEVWRVWNSALYVGLDIPLGSRTSLCTNVAYNFFLDYGDDFNGQGNRIKTGLTVPL